jgi:hypothetical protein
MPQHSLALLLTRSKERKGKREGKRKGTGKGKVRERRHTGERTIELKLGGRIVRTLRSSVAKGGRPKILPLARAFARPAIVILEKPTAARLVVEEPSYLGTATSTLPPDKDPRASGGIRRRTSSHPALAGLARWFPLRQDHPALVVLRQFSVPWPTPAARS